MKNILIGALALLAGCGSAVTPCEGGAAGAGGEGGGRCCSGAECESLFNCDPNAVPAEQKTACDDGDPHTADRCFALGCHGLCGHVPVECDSLDAAAVQQAACDDHDPVTTEGCSSLNACL